MSAGKRWWAEWLSLPAAAAMGPVPSIMIDGLNLRDLLGACLALFVWAVVVSVVISLAGRFRYVVWNLATVALAIAVLVHYIPYEGNPIGHVRELATLVVIVWLIGSVVTSILPITLLVEGVRARKKRVDVEKNSSIVPPGLYPF